MTAAMTWGTDNEPKARKAYIDRWKEQDVDVQVKSPGLHLSRAQSFIGATSDGFIEGDEGEAMLGCLEIKCPFSVNGKHVPQFAT